MARTTSHPARAAVSGLDKEYLKMSMQTDLAEIAGGNLAESRSHNTAVLALSARMITDHTKSYKNAAALARKLGLSVPKSPSPAQQWDALAVAQFTGTQFDHWFSSLQVYDHMQAIAITQDEINWGSNSLVRKDARTPAGPQDAPADGAGRSKRQPLEIMRPGGRASVPPGPINKPCHARVKVWRFVGSMA